MQGRSKEQEARILRDRLSVLDAERAALECSWRAWSMPNRLSQTPSVTLAL
jgi:hypothetical protein